MNPKPEVPELGQADLEVIVTALEIGFDHASQVAHAYHESMRGFRAARHKELDDDVECVKKAMDIVQRMLSRASMQPSVQKYPTDATHFEPHSKTFYKRVAQFEWYVWSRFDKEEEHWCKSPGTIENANLFELKKLLEPGRDALVAQKAVEPSPNPREVADWVSLTDEEIKSMWEFPQDLSWMDSVLRLVRVVEETLKARNQGDSNDL